MKRALALATMLIATTIMSQPAAASVSLPPGSITVPSSGTFFYMNSQPGDYVGGGAESLYTRADTDITGSLEPGGTYFRGHAIQPSYTHWWYIDIAAPVGQPLAVGSYVGAFRAAFRPDGSPGLDISGDGRGCNTLTGKFDILLKWGSTLGTPSPDAPNAPEFSEPPLVKALRDQLGLIVREGKGPAEVIVIDHRQSA